MTDKDTIEIKESLARIETKLAPLLLKVDEHDEKLASIEAIMNKGRGFIYGGAAVILLACYGVGKFIETLFIHR